MRIATLALIGLAVVSLGVLTVGRPEQARAERRDPARLHDLQGLAHHLICLRHEGLSLVDRSPACPAPVRRTDPLTGEPYRVEAVSGGAGRACAVFETRVGQQWWGARGDYDLEAGCIVVRERDVRPS